ncbi:MAG: protoglobin domain-containing protein [Microthrixaceae bacterium]
MTDIAGYTYGADLEASPVSLDELDLLLKTLLWTDDDTAALRRAGEVLAPQVDDVLDLWYGFVGSHAHLVRSFNGPDGTPSDEFLTAVRARFGQWILDLCNNEWDETWLAYQEEIGRRHVVTLGRTDGIRTDETHVPMRYLIAFVWPITATVRDFLANSGASAEEVDAMHTAWFKAVTLTVTLWSRPYTPRTW